MSRTILQSFVLAALATFSAAALADPPGVVGRISSVQGQVTVVGEGEPAAAILNWPVSNADHITTNRGGRAEFRIGSTAVRVDGDSDLEVTDLDDDLLRLRLNYGSIIVRIKNPDMLRDFELSTPQARITLLEPGEIRVDADRTPDTSQISVLSGSARVESSGASLAVANGRRAEVSPDSVRTSVASRDYFDIWAQTRDREDDAAISTRYIPAEVTGYEELDRNGTWRDTVEYGAVWTPRSVAADWAPYRDGQWIWRDPWGWTWVDNAPWGYAPSHYGRWVLVDRRWCWAPGRIVGRPVWAPALVGWVGGTQLQVNVGNRGRAPGLGWYPLGPRDHYVPPYQVSVDHERRLTWTHNGRRDERRDEYHEEHRDHRDGVTVLPREQFDARHRVQVNKGPGVILAPAQVPAVTQVAAPQPSGPVRVTDSNRGNWQDRRDRDGRNDHGDRGQQPSRPGLQLQTQAPSQVQPATPVVTNDRNNDRNGRFADDVRRQQRQEVDVRDQYRRDQAGREQFQREQAQRAAAQQQAQQQQQQQQQQAQQQGQHQQAQREQAQREQAQREQAQREQAQREQAQREQSQRASAQQQQAQQQHWQQEQRQQQELRQVQQAQQAQQQQTPQVRQAPPVVQPQAQPNRDQHDQGRNSDQRKDGDKRNKEEGRDKNQIAR